MERVFISHSITNAALANEICHYLEKDGIPCWIAPRDVITGANWQGQITRGIEECGVFLLLLSRASNDSSQVFRELTLADNRRCYIIPVITEELKLSDDMEYYLSSTHVASCIGNSAEEIAETVRQTMLSRVKPVSQDEPEAAAPAPDGGTILPDDKAIKHIQNFPAPLNYGYYGREEIFAFLNDCIGDRHSVVCIYGYAGEGKSALAYSFLNRIAVENYYDTKRIFYWRFHSDDADSSIDDNISGFFESAIQFLGGDQNTGGNEFERGDKILELLNRRKSILILDDFECVQYRPDSNEGTISNKAVKTLINNIARDGLNDGLVLLLSRQPVTELNYFAAHACNIELPRLLPEQCIELFHESSITGSNEALKDISRRMKCHPLTIALLSKIVSSYYDGNISKFSDIDSITSSLEEMPKEDGRISGILEYYKKIWISDTGETEKTFLMLVSTFKQPVTIEELKTAINSCKVSYGLKNMGEKDISHLVSALRKAGLLLEGNEFDMFSLVRQYFISQFKNEYPEDYVRCNLAIADFYCSKVIDDNISLVFDMQPLYLAVYHYVQAGEYDKAIDVLWNRIYRGRNFFSQKKLGALANDLYSVSLFFDTEHDWAQEPSLKDEDAAWLLSVAAYLLNNLGSLKESEKLRRRDIEMNRKLGNRRLVAMDSENLARNLMLQNRLDESDEALLSALKSLDEISEADKNSDTPENGRYGRQIDIDKLRLSILIRRAFLCCCYRTEERFAMAKQILSEAKPAADIDKTDAFYMMLIDLHLHINNPGKVRKQIREFIAQSEQRNKPYEIAYGYALDAAADMQKPVWISGARNIERITAKIDKALALSKEAGRMDQYPFLLIMFIHMLLSICKKNRRPDLMEKIRDYMSLLENLLEIHKIKQFELEYKMLEMRLAVMDNDPERANAIWFELRADPICMKYYAAQLNSMKP